MTLPEGWVETTIESLAAHEQRSITDGPFGSALKSDHYTDIGIRVIRLNNIGPGNFIDDDAAFISLERFQELQAHEAKEGDFVTAALGEPLGRTCIIPNKVGTAIVKADCFRTRAHPDIDKKYLLAVINSPNVRKSFAERGRGIGRVRINLQVYRSTIVPVAPVAEQRRIVAKIDALTIRLARARADLERVMILARRLRSEVLSRCLSKHEAATPLGDLLTGIEAGKNLRCEERPPRAGERGVVKVSAVTWGRFDAQQSKTLPHDYTPPSAAKIRAGDLLISRANTLELVGATVLVEKEPNELYLSDKILRLVMPDADKRWVMWFLRSQAGRREIELRATGNQLSMRNISQGALRDIPIPYPDADVRRAGVEMIEAAFARADRLEAEAARARALLDRLEAAILAKAFRGELVPQDPNDEPASVLLDRIRAERAAAPKPKRGRARKAVG